MTIKDAWKWARGEIGIGIFLPIDADYDEETGDILLELQKRVPANVRISMQDGSKHDHPIVSGTGDGYVFNASEVTAQCPSCKSRIRLSKANRDKYCSKCGQALNWETLNCWKGYKDKID